jgi:hypothetical protein
MKTPTTLLDEKRAANFQEGARDTSLKYFCFRVVQDRDSKGIITARYPLAGSTQQQVGCHFHPSLVYRVTPAD